MTLLNLITRSPLIFGIAALLTMFMLSGCQHDNEDASSLNHASVNTLAITDIESPQSKPQTQETPMRITGTMVYNEFEGGFFGFIAANGKKYTLSGLDNQYKQNGLIIEVEMTKIEGAMTITQFGDLMQVHDVKVIDDSKVEPVGNDKSMM